MLDVFVALRRGQWRAVVSNHLVHEYEEILNLNPAMEPAKLAKPAKEETLRPVERRTHWVRPAKVTTPSFRVLSRLSRAIHSRF